jgi:ribosomal protein S12 methylthiotransferase accessory factor
MTGGPPSLRTEFLSTSVRVRTLQETLRTATALMPKAGITTIEDATADDVLGVPVWFSFRPGGRANSVHSGKGLRSQEAQVGALMEAIEFAAAESDALGSVADRVPISEVLSQFANGMSITDFAPRLGAIASTKTVVEVETCEDLHTARRFALPAELLLVPAPKADAASIFGWSSNGLASGNSIAEATLHGLLEVLERDTIAMDLAAPSRRMLDTAHLPEPLGSWAQAWSAVGIDLRVRPLDNEFGLPCFEAEIVANDGSPAKVARGWGLHLDSKIALARAVTEAAQTRLHAHRFGPRGPVAEARSSAGGPPISCVDFAAIPTLACESVDASLSLLLERLRQAGMQWVLRRPMSLPGPGDPMLGLHVVKVVVPGCENPTGAHARIGRRLARRLSCAA